MKEKNYFIFTGTVFGIASLLHAYRAIYSLPIPIWISWISVILAGYLSYSSFKILKTR